MQMLISKSNLVTYCQFTDNIEDRLINPIIQDTQDLEIEPLIDPVMFTNFNLIVGGSTLFPQLKSFFDNYVKQWICFTTYYNFCTVHGINVTQYGIRVNNEDTSVPVDPQDRAKFNQAYKNKGNAYYLRMNKELDAKAYTFDNIKYDEVCAKDRGNTLVVGRVGANRVVYPTDFNGNNYYNHGL